VKRSFLFQIFLLIYFASKAQITVKVTSGEGKTLYLQSFSLSGFQKTDSATVLGKVVTFPTASTAALSPGMYMIGDNKQGFRFILNESELEFRTVYPFMEDSLVIVKSFENSILHEYELIRDKAYQRLDMLNQVLAVYDPGSEFYRTTLQEFMNVQEKFERWTDSIRKKYPSAYVSHYIRADKKPFIVPGLKLAAQKQFFQEHWFDEVDWMDNTMMTSDVLTSKITSYLGLYSNPNIGKAELSQGFMIAVDRILPQARQNPDVYDFTLKYLIRGFERYGFEDVILHIATNYPKSEQCENDQQSETIARLEKYKLMAVGKTAPDLKLKDLNGNGMILSSLKSKKLVIFWASWCPHCKELIPQLISWSQRPANSEVKLIPVSLDESKEALQRAISELNITWPVYCDYKKWSSQAAIDYNIYATPTMLLLDNDNKILAKPMNIYELEQSLRY
jgi:thiol-disulfide isomerase/thioredoxin